MKPRIFLSHSTATPEGEAFLGSVATALEEEFDVLLDRTGLVCGEDWRGTLFRWMDHAHGAIMLLTREALESDFVAIEASVVSYRRSRDPNFALLPILVDSTGIADLQDGIFGALAFEAVQIQHIDSTDTKAVDTIRKALDRFRKQFPQPKTPFERLEGVAQHQLKKMELDSLTLENIGTEAFGWADVQSSDDASMRSHFARSLLSAGRESACIALQLIRDQLLRHSGHLLNTVAPTWIEMNHALPIAETVFIDELARRQLLLDTCHRLIMELYISRAFCTPCLPPRCTLIQIMTPASQDTVGDIIDQVVRTLQPRHSAFSPLGAAQIRRLLDNYDKREKAVFLLFPPDFVLDQMLAKELRKEFPTVIFFVATHQTDEGLLRELKENSTELTAPDLEEQEKIVYDFYAFFNE